MIGISGIGSTRDIRKSGNEIIFFAEKSSLGNDSELEKIAEKAASFLGFLTTLIGASGAWVDRSAKPRLCSFP